MGMKIFATRTFGSALPSSASRRRLPSLVVAEMRHGMEFVVFCR